nr:MAG TPA: hypothetical protein [Caudoviricetes sp.]
MGVHHHQHGRHRPTRPMHPAAQGKALMDAPAWLTVLVALVSSGGARPSDGPQTPRPARPHRGIPPPHTERIANATSHQRGATWLTTSSPASSPASSSPPSAP